MTYELLGDLHVMAREIDEAEKNYIQSADHYSREDNIKGQASALKSIGDMRFKQADYGLAEGWYFKALEVNKGSHPHIVHGQVHEAIGHLYWKTNKIPEAIKYFKQARATFASIKYVLGYEHLYHVLQKVEKISRQQRSGSKPHSPQGQAPY